MADPVSWLQIAQGWQVVSSDGVTVGTVEQVECDRQSDIFDGLAVAVDGALRYVPGEIVGPIYPGQVTLTAAASEVASLEPFQAALPETTFRPEQPGLGARISRWFRGSS